MKYTPEQRHMIVAEYSTGETSIRKLAAKYGISPSSIQRVLSSMPEAAQMCAEQKKANQQSMRAWLASRAAKAQSLLDVILDLDPDELRQANLRDKMGALKIIKEAFFDATPGNPDADADKDFRAGTFVVMPSAQPGEGVTDSADADTDASDTHPG